MTLRPLVLLLPVAFTVGACVVNKTATPSTQPPQGQGTDSTSTGTSTSTDTTTADDGRATHAGGSIKGVSGGRKKSTARLRIKSPKDPKKDDDKDDNDTPSTGGDETQAKAATITGFYPDTASPGSVVEISGSDFAAKVADNIVTSGGAAWEIKRVLNGRLIAVVPAKAKSGKVDIKIGKKQSRSKMDFHVMSSDNAFGRPASHFSGDWVGGLLGMVYPLAQLPTEMPDFANLGAPQAVLAASTLDIGDTAIKQAIPLKKGQTLESFAIRYVGSLNIVAEAEYELCLESDDGAQMWLEGQLAINNAGVHPVKKACEVIYLEAGEYSMELRYFQAKDRQVALRFTWSKDGGETQVVPATALFRPEDPAVAVK